MKKDNTIKSIGKTIKQTFRSDKRKALEVFMTASTQAEQDEALKNSKDLFEK